MFVFSRSALEDLSLTDTPGSTWSTPTSRYGHISVQAMDVLVERYIIHLYSASFPTILLSFVHAQLFAILHQLVDNALPHSVVDCLGFPRLLSELGYFCFQLFHPGIR
jgi:hypothetical protein